MSKESKSLAVLDKFRATALEVPDRVKAALATIDNIDDAAEALNQAEAMATYARRIRLDVEANNAIQHGVLLIKAKVGGMLKPKTAEEYGAMKGKGSLPGRDPFSNQTRATYRKIAKKENLIDDYRQTVDNHNGTLPEDHPDALEMNTVGFLAFVPGGTIRDSQSGNNEWYTPTQHIEAARKVMGSIDLDPASCDLANDTVRAEKFYDEEENGLVQPWWGNVWMNPPYSAKAVTAFVEKLCYEVECETVKQAVMLTNNATDTGWWHLAIKLAKAVCFTRGRVNFYNDNGEAKNPPNGHTFFYFGDNVEAFAEEFGEFGTIGQTAQEGE